MRVERFRSAKDVAEFRIDVCVCRRVPRFCSGFDGVVAAFEGGEVDLDVGGTCGRVRWVGLVDIHGDWGFEDACFVSCVYLDSSASPSHTKAIKFIRSARYFFQCLGERILLLLVCAEDGFDDALEEGSSCPIGMEDADRGYRYREGCIFLDLEQLSDWVFSR